MIDRTLVIAIDAATLTALYASGYHLYAFRPVTSSNKSGVPLVWGRVDAYLQSNSLSFTSSALAAYVSTDAIAVNQAIDVDASVAAATGQIVAVSTSGTLSVTGGAPTDDVYIASNTDVAYVSGLAAALGVPSSTPFCAFDLYPQVAVTMRPADAIFVMWATSTYDLAVYMQRSLGRGLLVRFGDSAQRSVSYDIMQGWETGAAAWATPVAAGANLVTTLILDPGSNQPLI
jgi:hypothetical protein